MPEYRLVLTWEAIYDVTDIADYIEAKFEELRAEKFQYDIREEIQRLGYLRYAFPKTQVLYRNYVIHKKPFSPSIIFYIIDDKMEEIHVLRVFREERDWKRVLQREQD